MKKSKWHIQTKNHKSAVETLCKVLKFNRVSRRSSIKSSLLHWCQFIFCSISKSRKKVYGFLNFDHDVGEKKRSMILDCPCLDIERMKSDFWICYLVRGILHHQLLFTKITSGVTHTWIPTWGAEWVMQQPNFILPLMQKYS